MAALKENGFNTTKLRREKLLSEGVIQALRDGRMISLDNVSKICKLSTGRCSRI
nr:helix-turn-helix domain-containing protein [Anaerotruncus rubiinfantis]